MLNSSYLNAKSTTGTTLRVRDASASSGMCPICIYECASICQIGLAALRGREALYPMPKYFGFSTAAAVKDFGIDWSHFNLLSTVRGAYGIDEDPDRMLFPNVSTETSVGNIKLRIPIMMGAYGSTDVARIFWEPLAVGAALSGVAIIVGENVCGVDLEAIISNGRIVHSREMERRVKIYREYWDGKYGDIIVQTNVEDQKLGVDMYVLSKLEVNCIERKWGQGAKAIGGEIRVADINKAMELKKRGYLILPDPEDPAIQEAYRLGAIKSFERHSRVGSPKLTDFVEDVARLREQGAKVVSIKTGNYRPADIAYTLKIASEAKVDYVTFDGAGGGTGMSPVPMMDEMGIPTVYMEAIVLKCIQILSRKGKHVPDIVIAGGFIEETQILKAIALSNFGSGPYVKAVVMGRAPITAAMKAEYFSKLAQEGRLPKIIADEYGLTPDVFLVNYIHIRNVIGRNPSPGTVGVYNYMERLRVGMQQLLAGMRKFNLHIIDRNDIVALTEIASKVTGIPMPHEVDREAIDTILNC
ncbi:MAG: glutamate synthase-related protein [Ignisphaera sp.]|uniref:FMN-binding glutamate synthase family protein n=1 Tax=Ignisphaera aggregans TaxID=334771 RepID=A0A7J3I9N9_9CREN